MSADVEEKQQLRYTYLYASVDPEEKRVVIVEAMKVDSLQRLCSSLEPLFRRIVARILLFVYLFYHVYLHFDEVPRPHAFGSFFWVLLMHTVGFLLVFAVPSALATMNLVWFRKILRGLKKTLVKRQ